MRVYTTVAVENPGQGYDATCQLHVVGDSANLMPIAESRGVGTGPDGWEATHDAIIAAELALPEPGEISQRQRSARERSARH
jgi:hypothetical protein